MKKITKSDWSYMQRVSEIEMGGSCVVYLMKDSRTSSEYAVKKIRAPDDHSDDIKFLSEITVLEEIMAIPNSILPTGIVRYYGYVKEAEQGFDEDDVNEYYYLFFEVVRGKMINMMKNNAKQGQAIMAETVVKFFLDCVESLLFLQYQCF